MMVSDDFHEGVWQPGDDEHSEHDHQHANHLRQTKQSSFFQNEVISIQLDELGKLDRISHA